MTDETTTKAESAEPQAAAWTWRPQSEKPDAPPRLGYVRSAPLGDGSVFVVFGATDSIHYGYCDEKNGDPYFPGPYVVEGGERTELDVEHTAMAIFRAWKLGVRGGWEACRREVTELREKAMPPVEALIEARAAIVHELAEERGHVDEPAACLRAAIAFRDAYDGLVGR